MIRSVYALYALYNLRPPKVGLNYVLRICDPPSKMIIWERPKLMLHAHPVTGKNKKSDLCRAELPKEPLYMEQIIVMIDRWRNASGLRQHLIIFRGREIEEGIK